MPWVRIDENAMDHPKIGALPDGAFRLWVQGLAYCQKHLTDGFISTAAIRALLAFSPKRRAQLETAGLWDQTDLGICVHDYLVWNESREAVTLKRDAAKERMRQARERRSLEVLANIGPRSRERSREVLRGVSCSEDLGSTAPETGKAGSHAKPPVDRVQRFMDRYRELHELYVGVAYLGNPVSDYREACTLVAAFDDAMLEALTVYWLNDGDKFASDGTRTVAKLRSRASKYAEELKAKKLA